MDLAQLFGDHIGLRQAKLDEALAATGFDTLILSSGAPLTYFADDRDAPFWSHPHFAHWTPLRGAHHLLKLQPGRRPRLVRHAPPDFWYEQAGLGDPYWLSHFDLVEADSREAAWSSLGECGRCAYVGNEDAPARAAGFVAAPEELLAYLDWGRSYKTAYEVRCLEEATAAAARGHQAARAAFLDGASELEIHHAFVQAAGVTDDELPYTTIVALDAKGAILHYQTKRHDKPGRVLLIDAGTQTRGYAADITRTHVAPDCPRAFAGLLRGMQDVQANLCRDVRPGASFVDLHMQTHHEVAVLLREHGLLRVEPDEAVAEGFTRAFFPHGLGHHLGLQVHDVAGHQAAPAGGVKPPPREQPFLRNTRTMEVGQVFTIEPGLYFMPLLLDPLRAGKGARAFNWDEIDELLPCGGIRVEDNILVTSDGHRNLTREHLPE